MAVCVKDVTFFNVNGIQRLIIPLCLFEREFEWGNAPDYVGRHLDALNAWKAFDALIVFPHADISSRNLNLMLADD